MGIYISGVKGLPEQVQKNKEDIKTIQDDIEGIDWDSIHNLENQVAENTQDIDDLQQGQGVQDTAINAVASKTSALNQSATTLTVDSNLSVEGNIGFNNDDSGNIELNNETNGGNKIVSKQDSNNYIDFDSSNNLHIMSDGGEYEFSNDQILVNGTAIGGGSNTYLTIKYSGVYEIDLALSINKDDFPTAGGNIRSYLNSLGFTSADKVLTCNGYYSNPDKHVVIGIYGTSTNLYIKAIKLTDGSLMYASLGYTGNWTIEKITIS